MSYLIGRNHHPLLPVGGLALLLTFVIQTMAVAHPFHVTIAEAEWNPKTKSLEVSLRVNPSDVERVLRDRLKRSIELVEDDAEVEKELFAYLQERLVVRSAPKTKCKPKWVGMEVKINRAWLYFEYPMPEPPSVLRIDHRVFHELEADQVNTLLLKVNGQKVTRHFTRYKAGHELPFVRASASDAGAEAATPQADGASR